MENSDYIKLSKQIKGMTKEITDSVCEALAQVIIEQNESIFAFMEENKKSMKVIKTDVDDIKKKLKEIEVKTNRNCDDIDKLKNIA